VIFIVGTGEGVDLLANVESSWINPNYRPFYILGDGIPGRRVVGLLNVTARKFNIKDRILGTTPGTSSDRIEEFVIRYQATYPHDDWRITAGSLGSFDAAYLIAYSTVANRNNPITGSTLASGLGKLLPPAPQVHVGFNSINAAISSLQRGDAIDLIGVSGPLDFDPKTGDCESDYQIWCPNEESGYYVVMGFDAVTGMLGIESECP
jgi:hypothetical protein